MQLGVGVVVGSNAVERPLDEPEGFLEGIVKRAGHAFRSFSARVINGVFGRHYLLGRAALSSPSTFQRSRHPARVALPAVLGPQHAFPVRGKSAKI